MWELIFSDMQKEAKRIEDKKKYIHNKQVSLNYYKKKAGEIKLVQNL